MSEVLSKLWRAVRYLFAPGNVLYWGLVALANIWVVWHPARPSGAILVLYVVIGLLVLAKMCDGMMRVSEGLEHEPVPFAPVSIVPFSIVFKYLAGIILWVIPSVLFIFAMKSAQWAVLLAAIFFWAVSPAMVMNLVGNNSLMSMISPTSWLVTMRNLGWQYVAILLLPAVFTVMFNLIAALLAAQVSVKMGVVLICVADPFFVALTWVYCGYFMRADAAEETLTAPMHAVLAEADIGMLSDAEQRAFAQDMLTVDMLMEEGAGGIEEILAPYVARDAGMWFPAFARQYALLQRRGGRDALRQFEDRLLARAASGDMHNGEMRLYTLLRHALLRIAEDDPARLHGDWIAALLQLANAHGDHDMVLHLTHGFHQRHPEHKDTVGNYYLRARALDRLGRREESVKLLTQLLEHYPDHPRAAQIRRTLTLLQKPS